MPSIPAFLACLAFYETGKPMNREKLYFGIGLVMGIVMTVLLLQVFAPRYRTVKLDGAIVKQDRWSGNSWRFVDNEWQQFIMQDVFVKVLEKEKKL